MSIKTFNNIISANYKGQIAIDFVKMFPYDNKFKMVCLNADGKLELIDLTADFLNDYMEEEYIFTAYLEANHKYTKFVRNYRGYFGLLSSDNTGKEKRFISGNLSHDGKTYKKEKVPTNIVDFTISLSTDTYYYLYNDGSNLKVKAVKAVKQQTNKDINISKATMGRITNSHHHEFLVHDYKTVEIFDGDKTTQFTIDPFSSIISLYDYGYGAYDNNILKIYSPKFVPIMFVTMTSKISQLIQISDVDYVYLDERKRIRSDTIPKLNIDLKKKNIENDQIPLYIGKITNGIILVAYTTKLVLYSNNMEIIDTLRFTLIKNVYLYNPFKSSSSDLNFIYVVTNQYLYKLSPTLIEIEQIDISVYNPFEKLFQIEKMMDDRTLKSFGYVLSDSTVTMYEYNKFEERSGKTKIKQFNEITDIILLNDLHFLLVGKISYICDSMFNIIGTISDVILSATQLENGMILATTNEERKLNIYNSTGISLGQMTNPNVKTISKIISIYDKVCAIITNNKINTIQIFFDAINKDIRKLIQNIKPENIRRQSTPYDIKFKLVNDELIFDFEGHNFFDELKSHKNIVNKLNTLSFRLINYATNIPYTSISSTCIPNIIFLKLKEYITQKSNFFTSENTIKGQIYSFVTNQQLTKERQTDLYFLGQMFGIALLNEIPIGIKLHPLILYHMINDPLNNISRQIIDDIIESYDPIFYTMEPFACFKPELAVNIQNCVFDEDNKTTLTIDFRKRNSIDSLIQLTIKRFGKILKEQKNVLDSFTSGFKNIVSFTIKPSLKIFDKLITGITELSIEIIDEYVEYNWSGDCMESLIINGITVKTDIANDAKEAFRSLLIMHQKLNPKYFNVFIQMLTGSPYIPVSGYNQMCQPTIDIVYSGKFKMEKNSNKLIVSCVNILDFMQSTDKEETSLYKMLTIEELQKFINGINA